MFFRTLGMKEPNSTCAKRYFCRRSAFLGTPDQGLDANICPQGHYCPAGTGEPEKCPSGTYTNHTGYQIECKLSM